MMIIIKAGSCLSSAKDEFIGNKRKSINIDTNIRCKLYMYDIYVHVKDWRK